jgi:hypothetical protein
VTRLLGVEPTGTQKRGQPLQKGVIRTGGWFLTTEGAVASRDVCRHLDWLLDRLVGRGEALRQLQEQGCRLDLSCSWVSASGHGGPTLYAATLTHLAELGIEVGFDVYFDGRESTPDVAAAGD